MLRNIRAKLVNLIGAKSNLTEHASARIRHRTVVALKMALQKCGPYAVDEVAIKSSDSASPRIYRNGSTDLRKRSTFTLVQLER